MRIQVLHLPGHAAGELEEDRFALVVDQVEVEQSTDGSDDEVLHQFGHAIGAQGVLVTPETVEVV